MKNRHAEIDIAVAISGKMQYNNQGSCYFPNWQKKWGILIKKESKPLINQGIKIPRDY